MADQINWHKVADHFEALGNRYEANASALQRTKLKYKAPSSLMRAAACFDMAEALREGMKS